MSWLVVLPRHITTLRVGITQLNLVIPIITQNDVFRLLLATGFA
ncbi:hypothetical protein [Okeania sp.]|nr:hypothetical protein [Okeania sp.]